MLPTWYVSALKKRRLFFITITPANTHSCSSMLTSPSALASATAAAATSPQHRLLLLLCGSFSRASMPSSPTTPTATSVSSPSPTAATTAPSSPFTLSSKTPPSTPVPSRAPRSTLSLLASTTAGSTLVSGCSPFFLSFQYLTHERPVNQYNAYVEFALKNQYRQLIDQDTADKLTQDWQDQCIPAMQGCTDTPGSASNKACSSGGRTCSSVTDGQIDQNFDPYDIRASDDSYPPGTYVNYLNSAAVKKAIGAQSTYQECGGSYIGNGDGDRSFLKTLGKVVDSGVNTLIWAGDAGKFPTVPFLVLYRK